MKTWLKGGLIGGGINLLLMGIVYALGDSCLWNLSDGCYNFIAGLLAVPILIPSYILAFTGIIKPGIAGFLISSFIIYVIVGAVIGLIFGKRKAKQRKEVAGK